MNERGSITLEAAISIPFLLFFGLALSWMLVTARTEAALREAVEEAVKTTAAHAYPVDLAARVIEESEQYRFIEAQIGRFLPHSVKAMLQERRSGDAPQYGSRREWSRSGAHRIWAEPFVMSFVDRDARGKPLLDEDRLTIRFVRIPNFSSEEGSYFGLSAEYRLTLPIPFLTPEVVLKAAALERCWVGEKGGGAI